MSKVNTKPAATLRLARSFSQTPRVANEESADQDPPPAKKSDFPADTHTSIYISNMTFDATEVHLKEAFSQYGEIEDIRIVKDGRGLSRGYVPSPTPVISGRSPKWISLANSPPPLSPV